MLTHPLFYFLAEATGIVRETPTENTLPGGTSSVSPPKFAQILENTYNNTNSIVERWSEIWEKTFNFNGDITISGETLFSILCYVGLVAATGCLIFFAVHNFKLLTEGNYKDYCLSLLYPLVIVVLIGNGGKTLSSGCFSGRFFMNEINQQVLEHVTTGITLQEAFHQLQQATGTRIVISNYLQHCEALTGDAQTQCIKETAKNVLDEVKKLKTQTNPSSPYEFDFQKQLYESFEESLEGLAASISPITSSIETYGDIAELLPAWETTVFSILSGMMKAYQHFLEISLYVSAIVSPLAVGGSLLPNLGSLPILAWLSGYFAVGFAKLTFNMAAGLAALAAANDLTLMNDQLSLYFIFGLGAPLVSSGMMVGGGMAIWKSLTGAAEATVGFAGQAVDLLI